MKKVIFFKAILPALIVASLISFVMLEYQRFINEPLNVTTQNVTYVVAPGMNLKVISKDLQQKGLTDIPPLYLQLYGRFTSQAHLIKAGEYAIQPGTTLPALLSQLVSGKVLMNALTVVEGMTAQQLINMLVTHPKIKVTLPEPTVAAAMNALGEPEKNGEGWFLPETYHFPTGTTDIEFLKRAYTQMQQQLEQAWEQRDENLPYQHPYEALIMASVIEKETAIADERSEIAGVFVRRLQKGMRLQTDPTVIYGLGDTFDGNLRKKDLQTDTPFNTYTRAGLPPAPICLPSIESIQAALHPAAGDSLYFVATGKDGRHVFSSNLRDHNNAVRRYQLKKQ
ncbi:endolytic transglycosylase MltG [Methylophaga sp. OBS4]|uniref:endolytic transglycosylase MltG n=1 Tax=Methylophaga sp. OBS4 TaxID=2991935 RepID=UPI0022501548|nr:endolytic transglycosylase MltG [Methylophaga sp. OBS4]MCX4188652.1 endolytic transglycosylase MltG [Methylophaga sp. OBS4]